MIISELEYYIIVAGDIAANYINDSLECNIDILKTGQSLAVLTAMMNW